MLEGFENQADIVNPTEIRRQGPQIRPVDSIVRLNIPEWRCDRWKH